jgi:hypothetical protein
LLAGRNPRELKREPLVEQGAVRQVGQRIVMREMRDAFLGTFAFRDIFVRGDPSAMRQRTVYDLYRAAFSSGQLSVCFWACWITLVRPFHWSQDCFN